MKSSTEGIYDWLAKDTRILKKRQNISDDCQRWKRTCQLSVPGNAGFSEGVGGHEAGVWQGLERLFLLPSLNRVHVNLRQLPRTEILRSSLAPHLLVSYISDISSNSLSICIDLIPVSHMTYSNNCPNDIPASNVLLLSIHSIPYCQHSELTYRQVHKWQLYDLMNFTLT